VAINKLIFPVLTNRYLLNSVWHIFFYDMLDIGARLEHTPRKSLKFLPQETGTSKSSAKMATQLPKMPSSGMWGLLDLDLYSTTSQKTTSS
jgi:hypothetical protein